MQEDNLPSPGTVEPLTFDQQVEKIGSLIGDPETPDPTLEENEDEAAPETEAQAEEPEAEDVETGDAEEQPDGPQEDYTAGRFAADNAKVRLDDGSVISVADLKRNNLFQRDYTKKTQELAAEREQITSRKSEVDQQAQSLIQASQYINWYAEHYLPKQPEPFQGNPQDDPIGYMQHMQRMEAWQQQQGLRDYFNAELAKIEHGKKAETEAQKAARLQQEARALFEKDKTFADETKRMSFLNEAVTKGAEYWGLTREEIAGLDSHKQWLVLRDALAYRRLQQKAPGAVEQVKAKPKMVTGTNRRGDPNQQMNSERRVLAERLRKSGSIEDGAALLSRFKL